ncbi:MAG TPA: hypothetical protein VK120_05925 [Sporosarcina sp.]|nr:hypothetical protein [Sporosarcina sp.]
MGMWLIPTLITSGIIILIGILSVRKTVKFDMQLEREDIIPEKIAEHPFTLNPIIWIIFIALAFMGIVIVYYATTTTPIV